MKERLSDPSLFDDTCSMCGGGDFNFEPATMYCCEPSCGSRIQRSQKYYSTENKKYQVGGRDCHSLAVCV